MTTPFSGMAKHEKVAAAPCTSTPDNLTAKRQRNEAGSSCAEMKTRCDREKPHCGGCQKRGIVTRCTYLRDFVRQDAGRTNNPSPASQAEPAPSESQASGSKKRKRPADVLQVEAPVPPVDTGPLPRVHPISSCSVPVQARRNAHQYDPAFADAEATVVLTSSDGISYRVHPFNLRTASTLPQVDAILDEPSKVLGRLLRMISGLGAGKWETLDDVRYVAAAAQKYGMLGPVLDIRCTVLASFLAEQPLKVFLFAARCGWEDEAKLASKHTLQISLHDDQHAPVLDQIPPQYLNRLTRLHRTRRDKFKAHILRDNKCFGIGVCPCCHQAHTQADAPALLNLVNLMVWEMDRQPAGLDLLSGKWKEWPAIVQGGKADGGNCINVY
ncbi:hypothetical protein FIBSPDRAFT_885450 [Athelia psychrophila]|uniref:Zn(2)-C6 fungal-type domain-containing protein n=1 Tax=Athelia psychrophila TaxID=1759441 RepID=A0A166RRL2_9AGAM|nr:hypothetical protein FIBSPDRAFT_885450 [Fibularhizoctonia sp. CBS 109695]